MVSRAVPVVVVFCLATGCANAPETSPETSVPATSSPATGPVAPPTTDEGRITSAMSAAPEAVARDATIVAMDDMGGMRTLRTGTNGWTCFPDVPNTPGADPMCVDKNGMDWAHAWMSKTPPPAGKMGFGYMLAGGSDASNTDPFATEPHAGTEWIETGPHVMIFNIGSAFDGYPTTPGDAKTPYVMWSNTPYVHLMIPVK
jgi:hypothetical protein